MRTARLAIEWTDGETVPGWISRPRHGPTPKLGVLLAHGAGAGQDHPFMKRTRSTLVEHGFSVLAFEYPYMAAGRRAPDRLPKLIQCHLAAASRMDTDQTVFAGKSMGGRVGGHAAVDWPVAGVAFLGYPLVAIGKDTPRPVDHLADVGAPILAIQGERDRMGPPGVVKRAFEGLADAAVVEIPDADHSFNAPKRAGDRAGAALTRLVAWLKTLDA